VNIQEIHAGDVLVWHKVPVRVVSVQGGDVVIDVASVSGGLHRLIVDPDSLQPDSERRFVDHPLRAMRRWRCLATVAASPTHQAGRFELTVTAASAAEAQQIAVHTLADRGHDKLWLAFSMVMVEPL
jgi:hypothetical protein